MNDGGSEYRDRPLPRPPTDTRWRLPAGGPWRSPSQRNDASADTPTHDEFLHQMQLNSGR